jgi:hypothetical protein
MAVVLAPQAIAQLGDILKGAAIVVIVDKFGGQINKAINGLTGSPNRESGNKTKIVPILSVGQGTSAGAAQVSGPIKAVDSVQAVAQVEGNVRIGTSLRLKALIPISTRNVKDNTRLKRVYGVGITGLIDARL